MSSVRTLLLAAFAVSVAACNSSDDPVVNSAPPAPTASLQVLHASSDAPAVKVIVDGNELLSGVDYKEGSARLLLDPGTYSIQVDGITPGGDVTVIGPVDLTFDVDTVYTVAAVGKVGDGTIEAVVLNQPRAEVAAGSARAFVLHGASDAPAVDVYVTTPGADLAATAPLGSFSYKESLGPVEVAAGDYQIRVTLAGDPAAVVYDTGTIALNDGDDLLLTAVNNTIDSDTVTAPASPISLAVLTGFGSAEILDASTSAAVRVVHASADAPNVDVIVDDAVTLVSDLAFPDATPFVPVDAATYNVKVTAAGNASAIVIDADLTLDAGVTYDILAVNELAAIEPLVLTDDYRSVITEAKVRIIHASPTAQDVDIYITEQGADITNVEPTLADIPFKANTGFLSLAAGAYDVTVTPAGSKMPAIGPASIAVNAGGIYTAIARDAAGGGTPLNLILLDDFQTN